MSLERHPQRGRPPSAPRGAPHPPSIDADAGDLCADVPLRTGTHAADGLERRAFTIGDCARMQDIGLIGPDERYELIEGDLVLVQAKNSPHERIKLALVRLLSRHLPDHLQLGVETSLFLSARIILQPDLCVFPAMEPQHVRGPDVLPAVEVASTTLRYDLGLKARLYARYGVPELWVIDAASLRTHVHRVPVEGEWSEVTILDEDMPLKHPTAPGFSLVLSGL